ncbi:MAG: glycerol kinase GlpK [Candidatus Cryptobacteroides sp.]|nr:glycerol kinase GlpK [Bacteroidales bacterium]MDY2774481.1 glycerol kinase GlpK [Candidatus Cryptobacteroides sp.]
MKEYIVALDQGTSSSRAIVFNRKGEAKAVCQKEFTQHFPQPGIVEHDPMEIWATEYAVMTEAVTSLGLGGADIAAIGITNQRETTIVWDAATGKPICNAIVWQDRRTSEYCDSLKEAGLTEMIRSKTGLIIDAYFSGTKIRWILENVPGARERAERGELRFGTVDSWLVWNLTGGHEHVTDVSNASRTMLFNIHTLQWDAELLDILGVPLSMMPQVKSSSEVYGRTSLLGEDVPVSGIAGDQQAALFGQMCTEQGAVKNTYGTGCFLLMNTGEKPIVSKNNLLTTIAWKLDGRVTYALEGSIFVAGSVVQWLRDGLGIIRSSSEVEALAASVSDAGGVYMVPALTGLGAPYWDQYAKGSIHGITRGTTAAHIARAALEGIAFQTMDIVSAMEKDAGVPLGELKVDGGASRNNLLMQFQSDVLGTKVVRPLVTETTALGAAYLAGLAVGFWKSIDEVKRQWQAERIFTPTMAPDLVALAKKGWADAVDRTLTQNSPRTTII